jgi:CRISPR-associated Cas5-like protein
MKYVCLGLRLIVPFWCSFRDPVGTNLHRTFPVPPPSTLYGLVAAALGLAQDDQSRRGEMRFAVAVRHEGELVESYSKWMKAAEGPKDEKEANARAAMRSRGLLTPDESVWISTTIIRQKLIQPVFDVGVLCALPLAREISDAVDEPAFPISLGESDDVVDIVSLGIDDIVPTNEPATGVVSGVQPGGILASLPCRFQPMGRGRWRVSSWLVTVPRPGSPIPSTASDLLKSHGHVWSFEPTDVPV